MQQHYVRPRFTSIINVVLKFIEKFTLAFCNLHTLSQISDTHSLAHQSQYTKGFVTINMRIFPSPLISLFSLSPYLSSSIFLCSPPPMFFNDCKYTISKFRDNICHIVLDIFGSIAFCFIILYIFFVTRN